MNAHCCTVVLEIQNVYDTENSHGQRAGFKSYGIAQRPTNGALPQRLRSILARAIRQHEIYQSTPRGPSPSAVRRI